MSPVEQRTSFSTTSQPRREQPLRANKVIQSVEGKDRVHFSPSFGPLEVDAGWEPPEDNQSGVLSFGSTPNTSNQGSPCSNMSKTFDPCCGSVMQLSTPGSLLQDPQRLIKREIPAPGISLTRSTILAPTLNRDLQNQRLEEHGYFELHEADAAYAALQREKKESQERVAARQAAYEKSLRSLERDPTINTENNGNSEPNIQRGLTEMDFHVRHYKKPKKFHVGSDGTSKHGTSVAKARIDNSKAMIETHGIMIPDNHASPKSSSQGNHHSGNELGNGNLSSCRISTSNSVTERTASKRRKLRSNFPDSNCSQEGAKNVARKGPRRRDCRCEELHEYFTTPGLLYPIPDDFPGSLAEFLAHASQVAECAGHDALLTENCEKMLRNDASDQVHDPPSFATTKEFANRSTVSNKTGY